MTYENANSTLTLCNQIIRIFLTCERIKQLIALNEPVARRLKTVMFCWLFLKIAQSPLPTDHEIFIVERAFAIIQRSLLPAER